MAHAELVVASSTISLVLRVLSEPASEGRLVGQAEVVETGEIVSLTAPDELLHLVRRLAGILDS
ncbi:MAG: hypothetical protein QOH79_3369 [Acidimicrobiaceae bacterium]